MNIENLRRVFIHETGHFLARTLNLECFNIGAGVENIIIKTYGLERVQEYVGETIPKKPNNYVETNNIENVPEYLAVLFYGCIFQSFIKSLDSFNNFQNCFNPSNKANGKFDFDAFRGLDISGIRRKALVDYIQTDYVVSIAEDSSHIDRLLKLDPLKYLLKNKDVFVVNLELLEDDLSQFIEEHKTYYLIFLKNINQILEGKHA